MKFNNSYFHYCFKIQTIISSSFVIEPSLLRTSGRRSFAFAAPIIWNDFLFHKIEAENLFFSPRCCIRSQLTLVTFCASPPSPAVIFLHHSLGWGVGKDPPSWETTHPNFLLFLNVFLFKFVL